MYTVLLVDSDTERGQLVAAGITGEWNVRVVGSAAEVLSALQADDSIARIVCSYRFGHNETAITLHAMLSDWLATMQVDMTVTLWDENDLDPLEQLYFDFHGVDLILTWKEVDHALLAATSLGHGAIS